MSVVFNFAHERQLIIHFDKHRLDFGVTTKEAYLKLAQDFVQLDLIANPHILQQVRKDGIDIVRFNPLTDEFAIFTAAGIIRTYYKPQPKITAPAGFSRQTHNSPDNLNYFSKECRK